MALTAEQQDPVAEAVQVAPEIDDQQKTETDDKYPYPGYPYPGVLRVTIPGVGYAYLPVGTIE